MSGVGWRHLSSALRNTCVFFFDASCFCRIECLEWWMMGDVVLGGEGLSLGMVGWVDDSVVGSVWC